MDRCRGTTHSVPVNPQRIVHMSSDSPNGDRLKATRFSRRCADYTRRQHGIKLMLPFVRYFRSEFNLSKEECEISDASDPMTERRGE